MTLGPPTPTGSALYLALWGPALTSRTSTDPVTGPHPRHQTISTRYVARPREKPPP